MGIVQGVWLYGQRSQLPAGNGSNCHCHGGQDRGSLETKKLAGAGVVVALCRNGIGWTTGTGFCIARQCDCHWYVIGASNTHMDSHRLCIFAMPWVTLIMPCFGLCMAWLVPGVHQPAGDCDIPHPHTDLVDIL